MESTHHGIVNPLPPRELAQSDVDLINFLNCLPTQALPDASTGPQWSLEGFEGMSDGQDQTSGNVRGQKRTFDYAFDWFSWDSYYGGKSDFPPK